MEDYYSHGSHAAASATSAVLLAHNTSHIVISVVGWCLIPLCHRLLYIVAIGENVTVHAAITLMTCHEAAWLCEECDVNFVVVICSI